MRPSIFFLGGGAWRLIESKMLCNGTALRNHISKLHQMFRIFTVVVVRSFGGVRICYYFRFIDDIPPSSDYHLNLSIGRTLETTQQEAAPGAKSDVYDCITIHNYYHNRERKRAENCNKWHNKIIFLNCNQRFGNFKP